MHLRESTMLSLSCWRTRHSSLLPTCSIDMQIHARQRSRTVQRIWLALIVALASLYVSGFKLHSAMSKAWQCCLSVPLGALVTLPLAHITCITDSLEKFDVVL